MTSSAPILGDISSFNQIWVTDLSSDLDNSANHLAVFNKVAAWYNDKKDTESRPPALILDGRMLSSLWSRPASNNVGCGNWATNVGRPNRNLMENYFFNIHSKGGGLLLATDHHSSGGPHACGGSFVHGINTICSGIDISQFTGCYAAAPYAVTVDTSNQLMNSPNVAGHSPCNGNRYLWDDSSTSVPATGLQNNGIFLYSIAWHGNDGLNGYPAISASFRGSIGYLVSIAYDHTCGDTIHLGTAVTCSIQIDNPGAGGGSYQWFMDSDSTPFSTATSTIISSSTPQTISVRLESLDDDFNLSIDNLCLTWADIEGPLVTMNTVAVTKGVFTVTLTFSEPATTTGSPLIVTNGALETPLSFTSETSISFNVVPDCIDGESITVTVPSDFVQDAAGNENGDQPDTLPSSQYIPSSSTLYSMFHVSLFLICLFRVSIPSRLSLHLSISLLSLFLFTSSHTLRQSQTLPRSWTL